MPENIYYTNHWRRTKQVLVMIRTKTIVISILSIIVMLLSKTGNLNIFSLYKFPLKAKGNIMTN